MGRTPYSHPNQCKTVYETCERMKEREKEENTVHKSANGQATIAIGEVSHLGGIF